MPRRTKDRIGLRYGRLVITESIYIRGLGTGWKCLCDCGVAMYASGSNLDAGNTQSCGCLFKETHTTHGKTKSRVYSIWKGMLRRCQRPNAPEYKNYGGRGITVCERWQKFEMFFEDMGDPPDGKWIDRIDNNGNYEPGNCQWRSPQDQLNNRRNNRVLTAFGRTQTLHQWAAEMKMPPTTLSNRILRAKLSPEVALTAPNRKGKPKEKT